MTHLIDKSAVVAEIKRRITAYQKNFDKADNKIARLSTDGRIAGLKGLLSFLDTLEVKEVDLKEKATQLSQKYFPDEENIWARSNIEAQKCKSACIEMVEWLKAQKGEKL